MVTTDVVPDLRILLHPALEDTGLGCRVIRLDQLAAELFFVEGSARANMRSNAEQRIRGEIGLYRIAWQARAKAKFPNSDLGSDDREYAQQALAQAEYITAPDREAASDILRALAARYGSEGSQTFWTRHSSHRWKNAFHPTRSATDLNPNALTAQWLRRPGQIETQLFTRTAELADMISTGMMKDQFFARVGDCMAMIVETVESDPRGEAELGTITTDQWNKVCVFNSLGSFGLESDPDDLQEFSEIVAEIRNVRSAVGATIPGNAEYPTERGFCPKL